MKLWHVLLGCIALVAAGSALTRYRERKLAAARSGQGFNEFAAHFSADGIPLYRLREVYAYFQNWTSVENFPVQADDDCCKVYGICEEDLDYVAQELAQAWRVKFPGPDELKRMPPVETVADLVRFLSRCHSEE